VILNTRFARITDTKLILELKLTCYACVTKTICLLLVKKIILL